MAFPHEILMMVFCLCLCGISTFGHWCHDSMRHRGCSLHPRHLNKFTGKMNWESVTKCAVTNADSGGHEQIKTKIQLAVQTQRSLFILFPSLHQRSLHFYWIEITTF